MKSFIKRFSLERIANSSLLKSSKQKLNWRERLALPKDSKLLDCGCGFGGSTIQAENDDFISFGFDISKFKIRFAKPLKKREKSQFLVASAERIPFKKNSFDVVYCNHVLEHLYDDDRALYEISRILRNKGFLILIVPNINNLATSLNLRIKRKFPFTDKTHFREYDEVHLKSILSKHHLKVVETKANDFIPPLASMFFHFIVIYLQLKKFTNMLAKGFPGRSLEIQLTAVKMDQ